MSGTEYQLLRELARHAGRVLTPEHLLRTVWGAEDLGKVRALRQAVYRLRRKLEPDPKRPAYIQSRCGLGYVFVVPE